MKQVYKSNFVEDLLDKSDSLMVSRWFNAVDLTNEIYRDEMLKHVLVVEEHRPKRMVIDTSDFVNFAIDPEIQEWASTEVFLRLQAAGVRKMAFVLSPDIITQMSIEQQEDQTRDTHQMDMSKILRSFDSEEAALEWIKEDTSVTIA